MNPSLQRSENEGRSNHLGLWRLCGLEGGDPAATIEMQASDGEDGAVSRRLFEETDELGADWETITPERRVRGEVPIKAPAPKAAQCFTKLCARSCADFEYFEDALAWYEAYARPERGEDVASERARWSPAAGAAAGGELSLLLPPPSSRAGEGVARALDRDRDGVPCPALPHTPVRSAYRMKRPPPPTP